MPLYVLTYKYLTDPSVSEVRKLRHISSMRILEHSHGIVMVEAGEDDLDAIREAAPMWTLSPVVEVNPLADDADNS